MARYFSPFRCFVSDNAERTPRPSEACVLISTEWGHELLCIYNLVSAYVDGALGYRA